MTVGVKMVGLVVRTRQMPAIREMRPSISDKHGMMWYYHYQLVSIPLSNNSSWISSLSIIITGWYFIKSTCGCFSNPIFTIATNQPELRASQKWLEEPILNFGLPKNAFRNSGMNSYHPWKSPSTGGSLSDSLGGELGGGLPAGVVARDPGGCRSGRASTSPRAEGRRDLSSAASPGSVMVVDMAGVLKPETGTLKVTVGNDYCQWLLNWMITGRSPIVRNQPFLTMGRW